LEQTTIDTRRYAVDKWIYPFFEGRLLAEVNNRAMKELVEKMAPKLSAASTHSKLSSLSIFMMSKEFCIERTSVGKQR